MSQVSIIDIEGNNPQIPTTFIANVGSAIPIANQLEVLGDTVAAGVLPVYTSASGNTLVTNVQLSQAIAASNALNVGLAAFDSSQFDVDPNGFVTLVGGSPAGAIKSVTVNTSTAPGTNPVLPNGSGAITVTGGQTATIGTVIQTHSLAANAYTIQVQQSGSNTVQNTSLNGVCHFDSNDFTVTNGFVTLSNSGSIATLTGDSGGAIAPVAGNITLAGGANIGTVGTAGTITFNLDNQVLQPNGNAGAPSYSFSSRPSDGLYNDGSQAIISWGGTGIAKFGFTIQVINLLELFNGLTLTRSAISSSPYDVTNGELFLSVDTSAARTIRLPNSPRENQIFIVKDRTGSAASNNITVTTPGGVVTFDGSTSYVLGINYGSVMFLWNSTSYEVFG